VEVRRAWLRASGMRPRKPAQAGFPPASRDFSRQAASGTTLSHQVRRSATRNRHATRCAQRLSEPLEPFRLRRDRRARRRVIRIGSKAWKSDGPGYGRAGCAPASPRRRASYLPAATSVARRRAEPPCRTRFVVPPRETVMRPGVLSAYPNHWNLFACGVIAVRAVGLFG
jgi:hypothetical protein